ncbi:NUDIX domain-containing protein [Jiangella endophytica]|uniref:NUDIX domain-containing protein n=1 Tax=Jiangella endophytica TaxID=1623398 RepID=UPI001300BD56|nr:NUDIX domain-containing protein [Jiangella endophytica]
MSEREDRFFAAVAARHLVRPSVRAIVVHDSSVLVQRPADSAPGGNYAFIGGEYEAGDTFESRLRQEIEEETTACLVSWRYLFVVENRFVHAGRRIHALEHYVWATLDTIEVKSREGHIVQEWLPLDTLGSVDLRPFAVRDVLANGHLEQVRHLVVDGWSE